MFKKENLATTSFIIIILLLVGCAIYGSVVNKKEESVTLKTTTDMKFNMEDQPVLGNPKAPVSMTVFYDYNCPHCQVWENEVLPVLQDTILKSDSVNLRFVNYQFMAQTSIYAGMAAEMVYEHAPEEFFNFNKLMFDNPLQINVDYLAEKVHETVPSLSVEQVKADLESQKYIDHILSDREYGVKNGVQGTPSFFVNGKKVDNPVDLEAIKKMVDEELEKVKESDK